LHWDIRRHGQPITLEQYHSLPEAPLELIAGHLHGRQEYRVTLLGALLQNVGIDAAVGLGDFAVWKEAIAARERAESWAARPGGRCGHCGRPPVLPLGPQVGRASLGTWSIA